MSKLVSFALLVSAELLVHESYRKLRIGLGKSSPWRSPGEVLVLVFSAFSDAPDPCWLPAPARLALLCPKPRLAEQEQQLLKESYGQRLWIFKVKFPTQICDTLYRQRSESFSFHGLLSHLLVMGTPFL